MRRRMLAKRFMMWWDRCANRPMYSAKVKNYPPCVAGDLIALRSAGAYGESMASTYNMRKLPVLYSSGENMGSHAGNIIGAWRAIARISAGIYFRFTTRRNIYTRRTICL